MRWEIRSDGVQVERSWIYGRRHVEFVTSADIIEIMVIEDHPAEFGVIPCILLRLAGRNIESPALRVVSNA
jgi:hypothetical protein